ncbi:gliding motility-associated C-terminal domain-containing protein [Chitinophaga sp. YIM B06452]|uniref:gliding motility-associated C-terminal domain-containing protein n=1 Tax=Chitinophaga sp. YIM B06452 TaxID=3082158 RepID=UPI0031FEC431
MNAMPYTINRRSSRRGTAILLSALGLFPATARCLVARPTVLEPGPAANTWAGSALKTSDPFTAPYSLNLSSTLIPENNVIGVLVGVLSTDPEAGVCTYSLAEGDNSTDNHLFTIAGNTLKAMAVFDFETKVNRYVRIRCTDANGGYIEKAFQLEVVDAYEVNNILEATNIVTPNGDGKNDTWVIRNLPANSMNEVRIIDRSGRVVYYKRNYQNDWNGRLTNGGELAEGVYYYIIDFGAGLHLFKGSITLIRSRN